MKINVYVKNCSHKWVSISHMMIGCRWCGETETKKSFILDKKALANNWN